MAGVITVTPQILGQDISSTGSYCYLYEPFRVVIEETDIDATKFYIDVELIASGSGVPETTLVKYAEFDINTGNKITVDLMKIAQQINNADIYKFAEVNDITNGAFGYLSVTAHYVYNFKIYSDETPTPVQVKKVLIIGERRLDQYTPAVLQTAPVNEFEYFGLTVADYETRWGEIYAIRTAFGDPSAPNVRSTRTKIIGSGIPPCGGFALWKSRFGGWMYWGFDMMKHAYNHEYTGNLETGMFESTAEENGKPYAAINYSGHSNSHSIVLKSLSLTSIELKAVAGIHASPAVYYQYPNSEKIELMRLTSANIPDDSLASGGDFSISLRSISKSSQLTI